MPMTTLPITLCDNYYRLSSDGSAGGGEAPTITSSPQVNNATKAVGEQATFSVAATGTPVLHYSWRKRGAIIPGAPDSASYTTPPVVAGDDGAVFTVLVSNGYGNTLSVTGGELTVTTGTTAPTIVTHPQGASIQEGGNATFNVVASGSPTLTYQWYKAPDNTTTGTPITGATSASYTITNATLGSAGWYYCTVTNPYGSATSNRAQLLVGAAGTDVYLTYPSPVNILCQGQPTAITVTDPAALSSEPGYVEWGPSIQYLTTSYPIKPAAYPSGSNGTVVQALPLGFNSYTEYLKFNTWAVPAYTTAPTLHVRVTAVDLKSGSVAPTNSYCAIDIYYGSTFITNLKTYDSATLPTESFPQDLTATLNTTGGYPTIAAVMGALEVRVRMQCKQSMAQANTNSITFNYKGFEVLGS